MSFFLSFENKHGRVDIGGAGHYIQLSEIEGLGPVQAPGQSIKLLGRPGETTTNRHQEPRYITLTGRIAGDDRTLRYHTQMMARVFDNITEGELSVNMYDRLRKIQCISQGLDFVPVSRGRMGFVLTLKADDPYFYEWQGQKKTLFYIENNLFDGMTFPRAFSYLHAGGVANNTGTINVEPVITIQSGDPGASPVYGLNIENTTTGAVIELRYNPANNEIITIDIRRRTITSSINGLITRYINPHTTALDKFVLVPGRNEITFENLNNVQPITADITYRNLYGEAVY